MDNRKLQKNPIENCSESVSYTHLRAHETVLDLVCRLLLEKKQITKKKKNKQSHIYKFVMHNKTQTICRQQQ